MSYSPRAFLDPWANFKSSQQVEVFSTPFLHGLPTEQRGTGNREIVGGRRKILRKSVLTESSFRTKKHNIRVIRLPTEGKTFEGYQDMVPSSLVKRLGGSLKRAIRHFQRAPWAHVSFSFGLNGRKNVKWFMRSHVQMMGSDVSICYRYVTRPPNNTWAQLLTIASWRPQPKPLCWWAPIFVPCDLGYTLA